MKYKTITVDVRDDIRAGREPFSKIMTAANTLQPDEDLLLIAPFEPVPLFKVLESRGFQYDARELESGDWEVLFTRQETSPSEKPLRAEPAAPQSAVVELDARGLEPPEPMVKILEAISTLPIGAELRARTDRRPMHLYPHLEERGFSASTEEQPDGGFLTCIRRPE